MSASRVSSSRGGLAVLRDWLARGPFAIAASALQGGMNYAIVLYLSFAASMAATGEYRTLFSCYSLLALAAMMESNKVYIRALVTGDRDAAAAVFANKLVFAIGAALVVTAGWGGAVALGWAQPGQVVVPAIAWISAIAYPFDLYVPHLQAQRRFQLLFFTECLKYGAAAAAFVAVLSATGSLAWAVVGQLAVMALCTLVCFTRIARDWVGPRAALAGMRARLASRPAGEARTLSLANILPASLEHVDKLLVGWVFGLSVLGVYTLAYSTGRFLYNILKPAMYVYYRRFVDAMPGWALLRRVGIAFTLLGAAMAAAFLAAVALLPQMAQFASGRWATAILFLSYGIGIVSAAYSQAFALNRDTRAHHALQANVLATLGSLVVLALALASPPATALVLLALQYPLRDGGSVALMEFFRRRGD